jgi:AraC family transcriptional regulator, glycine betaine-responsive activator
MKSNPKQKNTRVGFFLIEEFSMMCIATMINPLRSANRLLGYQAYIWDFLSHDDKATKASDGLLAPSTCPSNTHTKFDYFFVSAGLVTDPPYRARLNATLHRIARNSAVFGGLCTASFLLARAGMLNGYDFTLHWENQPAFAEEFPDLPFTQQLYVIDRDRWTGSGGLSSMDIALQIIEMDHGRAMAHEVGNQCQVDRVRSPLIDQRQNNMEGYDTLPRTLQSAIRLMQGNIEMPLSVPAIARSAGVTVRTLERLFNKHTGTAPATFYRQLRLAKARQLLWHTNISVLEIAFMTGFSSPSYLSRMYQAQYGKMPSQERR